MLNLHETATELKWYCDLFYIAILIFLNIIGIFSHLKQLKAKKLLSAKKKAKKLEVMLKGILTFLLFLSKRGKFPREKKDGLQ